MDKFHINAEGNPGKCTAKVKCPFGGDEAHYFSKEAAQKAFEDATKSEALKVWKKKVVAAPEPEEENVASAPDSNIGHGRSTYFHGHVSTPVPKPKAVPAKRAPITGHGGGHGWSSGAGRGGHGY